MILSLLFAFTADACCAKKAAAYYAKHGKHCCGKCKTRDLHNKKNPGKKEFKPPKGHVDHSNDITRVVNKVKKHHSRKHRKKI
jgi:hypothetical protein